MHDSPDERLPLDLLDECEQPNGRWKCPWCGKDFKDENGLRGHAHGKHAIKWKLRSKKPAEFDFSQLRSYDEYDTTDLKPWHRVAIFQNAVLGHSYKAVADALDRNANTIRELLRCEAAREMRNELQALMADNEQLLSLVLQASAVGVTMDDMTALQWAKKNKDYEFVHDFAMDYYKMSGIERKGEGGSNTLVINLETGSLDDVPEVRTSHEPLEAEIIDEEG